MDYHRIYTEFIEDRKLKEPLLIKGEFHHIKPRSMGGSDDSENLIRLSYQDHLFAHLLLAKVYGNGMWGALYWMINCRQYEGRRSRALYAKTRDQAVAVLKKSMIGNTNPIGVIRSEETRQKLSVALTGNTNGKGRRGIPHSEEAKARMSISAKRRLERPEEQARHRERSLKGAAARQKRDIKD